MTDNKRRYAVYPGQVTSRHDGQVHHIGFQRLCELFGVRPSQCVDMSRPINRLMWGDAEGLIHLHPRNSGDYTIYTGASHD